MPEKIFRILIIFLFICPCARAGDVRVVSLAPSTTEILFALGLDEKEIVGVTDYCDYPKEAGRIQKVGSLTTVSIEKIISLNPDYVFSASHDNSPLNSNLKKAGLKTIVINPESIEGTLSGILTMGKALNKEREAKVVVKGMRQELEEIENSVRKIRNKKKVYCEIWYDPITSCGKGSLVDEVITKAGGVNITGEIDYIYPTLNQEFIIKKNPDAILIGYMSINQKDIMDSVLSRYGWQDINAVKTKNVISNIDPNIFLRPGPRIVQGIGRIHRRLYPQTVANEKK